MKVVCGHLGVLLLPLLGFLGSALLFFFLVCIDPLVWVKAVLVIELFLFRLQVVAKNTVDHGALSQNRHVQIFDWRFGRAELHRLRLLEHVLLHANHHLTWVRCRLKHHWDRPCRSSAKNDAILLGYRWVLPYLGDRSKA